MIDNRTRELLGLNIVNTDDKKITFKECIRYSLYEVSDSETFNATIYTENLTIKKMVLENQDVYHELDYNIPLTENHQIIGRKNSKPKEITVDHILNISSKKMHLKILKSTKELTMRMGIKHFNNMYLNSLNNTDLYSEIYVKLIELYGTIKNWKNLFLNESKKVKIRKKVKAGQIFSYKKDDDYYRFGVVIGVFKDFPFFPEDKRHYLTELNSINSFRIITRTFDYKSQNNIVDIAILEQYKLLPPDIFDDGNLLYGVLARIGEKKLCAEDIVFPMSYTYNNSYMSYIDLRHKVAVARGRDKFSNLRYHHDINPDDFAGDYLELLNEFTKFQNEEHLAQIERARSNLVIRFDWGFGSKTIKAKDFLELTDKYLGFSLYEESGSGPSEGRVFTIENKDDSIFSEKKIRKIFSCLGIPYPCSFDQFNKLYGGVTVEEYLQKFI